MKVLVTGSAGFIGATLTKKLLARGDTVLGLDNLNDYYDVSLKRARLAQFENSPNYHHVYADLSDRVAVEGAFASFAPQRVVNLAAQAGVRYGSVNPHAYVASNITGFLHILEGCRAYNVEHLVFASTSSVYGASTRLPFSAHDTADHPLSLYAASKRANELMAHSYAHLYGIPCTGLRFFTVYGPWGRPDMALFMFTKSILAGQPIRVFNNGHHKRDFTFIDDIVEGVVRILDVPAEPNDRWQGSTPDPATSSAPFRIYNIGNQRSVDLMHYIHVLEACLDRKAVLQMLPLQPGDVPDTMSDTSDLARDFGYEPSTTVETGVAKFVTWYRSYYDV